MEQSRHLTLIVRCRQGNVPAPDPAVTNLEDQFIRNSGGSGLAQVTSQIERLSVAGGTTRNITGSVAGTTTSQASKDQQTSDFFPKRPAFGDWGKEVILWANYFAVDIKIPDLGKYTIEVVAQDTSQASSKKPARPAQPATNPSAPAPKSEIRGRKRQEIIRLALAKLKTLDPTAVYASEFKSQLVTLKRLRLAQGDTISVQYTEPGRDRVQNFEVKLKDPTRISVDGLKQFLATMNDPGDPDGQKFPKFEATIDALGVILGHSPRSDPKIASVGRGRFYPLDRPAETSPLGRDFLQVIRGYFQSVRPATGRILANANVTHGVFLQSGNLGVLMASKGLDKMNSLDSLRPWERKDYAARLRMLSLVLKRARVRYPIRDDKNREIMVEKTIGGLASRIDRVTKYPNQDPRFFNRNFHYGGPQQVKFYLREGNRPVTWANKSLAFKEYHSVEQYHWSSKSVSS